MSAGVKVTAEVADAWAKIKRDRSVRFASFKLTDDRTKVVLEKIIKKKVEKEHDQSKEKEEHDELIGKEVAMDGPRYLVINISYTDKENKKLDKLCLVYWCPEGSSITERMISSTTFNDVKKKFTGAAKYFEIQDRGDLSYEEFLDELNLRK